MFYSHSHFTNFGGNQCTNKLMVIVIVNNYKISSRNDYISSILRASLVNDIF